MKKLGLIVVATIGLLTAACGTGAASPSAPVYTYSPPPVETLAPTATPTMSTESMAPVSASPSMTTETIAPLTASPSATP